MFGNVIGQPKNAWVAATNYEASAELIIDTGVGFGNKNIPVIVTYNSKTWNYDALWTPRRSGIYQLNVTLNRIDGTNTNEYHIFGSPFLVKTIPAATFAPESIAEGGNGNCPVELSCPGMYYGTVGQESTFSIYSFDLNRNARGEGGDDWRIVLTSMSSIEYNPGRIVDFFNGTYKATVTPLTSGPCDLHVTLNDTYIKGSPFRMDVIHGPVSGES